MKKFLLNILLFTFLLHSAIAQSYTDHQPHTLSSINEHMVVSKTRSQHSFSSNFDSICTEHTHNACCTLCLNVSKDLFSIRFNGHQKREYDSQSALQHTFTFELIKPPIT